MIQIRALAHADIPSLKKIWKDTFRDTDNFINWYFSQRFFPEYSACAEEDGEIVSVCHCLPCQIYIRQVEVSGVLLNGVATLPSHRHRGLMRQTLSFLYEMLYQKGVVVMANTPVDFVIYRSIGHVPVSDALVLSTKIGFPASSSTTVQEIPEVAEQLYACYAAIAPRYSGMLKRTRAEFMRKCGDWLTDASRVVLLEERGQLHGYSVFADGGSSIYCYETLAHSPQGYRKLAAKLCELTGNKMLTSAFSVDADIPFSKKRRKSAMGLINARALLEALNCTLPYRLKVTDPFFARNNGVYDFYGRQYDDVQPADLEIRVEALTSWLVGYAPLFACDFLSHTKEAAERLADRLPAVACYMTDEY